MFGNYVVSLATVRLQRSNPELKYTPKIRNLTATFLTKKNQKLTTIHEHSRQSTLYRY
jgi:hypothetical protein